jgi:type II secretory pathway pseudopilin PulG
VVHALDRHDWRSALGMTLIEILIVVSVSITLAAIAVPISSQFINRSASDGVLQTAVAALENAQSRAVAERRNMRISFVGNNHLVVERLEVTGGTITPISDTPLTGSHQFIKFSIVDTPDHFGNTSATTFSGTAPYMFTSDGSLIDSNGDVVNGSIFIGIPGQVDTARAITIFGVTGLMRTWNWRGNAWFD